MEKNTHVYEPDVPVHAIDFREFEIYCGANSFDRPILISSNKDHLTCTSCRDHLGLGARLTAMPEKLCMIDLGSYGYCAGVVGVSSTHHHACKHYRSNK